MKSAQSLQLEALDLLSKDLALGSISMVGTFDSDESLSQFSYQHDVCTLLTPSRVACLYGG
jgi:hypothetical protein